MCHLVCTLFTLHFVLHPLPAVQASMKVAHPGRDKPPLLPCVQARWLPLGRWHISRCSLHFLRACVLLHVHACIAFLWPLCSQRNIAIGAVYTIMTCVAPGPATSVVPFLHFCVSVFPSFSPVLSMSHTHICLVLDLIVCLLGGFFCCCKFSISSSSFFRSACDLPITRSQHLHS